MTDEPQTQIGCVKLLNGIELVGEITSESNATLILKRPMIVTVQTAKDGNGYFHCKPYTYSSEFVSFNRTNIFHGPDTVVESLRILYTKLSADDPMEELGEDITLGDEVEDLPDPISKLLESLNPAKKRLLN